MSSRRTPLISLPVGFLAIAGMVSPRVAIAKDTQSSARPPALEGRTGCELWVGKVSGNDPSVLVEALICEGINGAVTGQLQWSSLESGYSIRDIAGSWHGRDELSLHDTKMPVSKPNPGWVFCMVDSYELKRSGDQLNGSYLSRKCNDRATVALTKKQGPPVAPSPSGPEPELAAPDAGRENQQVSERHTEPSSCACEAPRGATDAAALPSIALALVSCARRRRARSRAATPRASS